MIVGDKNNIAVFDTYCYTIADFFEQTSTLRLNNGFASCMFCAESSWTNVCSISKGVLT